MMTDTVSKDFFDMLQDAKKDPKKYQPIKSCKNLSDIYSFIKKIHPEYTFTEKELGKLILCLTKLADEELNVSGGTVSNYLNTVGYWTKFGAKGIDLFTDILFAEDEMNLIEMQQQINSLMENTIAGEAYHSDDMYSVSDSLKTVDKIDKRHIANLEKINSDALKKLSKSKNVLEGASASYYNKYKKDK